MYKVLIIDDEPIVRKGMVNVIRWHDLGCNVIGEAGNGLEGKKLIIQEKPDIILTDIHMPEMNGLEMIRETLEVVPQAQIIVLTGYRDFEYIQEALRLGASDYLLKPTKLGAIQDCVQKAINALNEQKKNRETLDKLERLFKKARPALLEKRLRDVVFRVSSVDSAFIEEMKLFGFELADFKLLLIEIGDHSDAYNRQLNKLGLRNAFTETFGGAYTVTPIDIGNHRILFSLQTRGENVEDKNDDEVLIEKIEAFMDMIKGVFDMELDSALSTKGSGLIDLYQKASECFKTIEYKHYLGSGAILLTQDFMTEEYDDISIMTPFQTSFTNAIQVGNVDSVQAQLNKMKKAYETDHCFKAFDIQDFFVRLSYDVFNYVLMHPDLTHDIFNMDAMHIQETFKERREIEAIYDLLAKWSVQVAENRNEAQNNSIDTLVVKAMTYMESRYSENISLKEVAEHVSISTYYLSRLFKRETGKNFSEYLTDYRMDKAKEYLVDSDMKLYEIADQIGLSDPHYFSRTFKKHVGLTPSQYREEHGHT